MKEKGYRRALIGAAVERSIKWREEERNRRMKMLGKPLGESLDDYLNRKDFSPNEAENRNLRERLAVEIVEAFRSPNTSARVQAVYAILEAMESEAQRAVQEDRVFRSLTGF